jgi:hypothetical protein
MALVGRYVLLACLSGYMVYAGFLRRPGWPFSWPMYHGDEITVIKVISVQSERGRVGLNPYDLRAPGEFMLSIGELVDIVEFLQQDGKMVELTGTVYGEYGEGAITIEGSDVVSYLPG